MSEAVNKIGVIANNWLGLKLNDCFVDKLMALNHNNNIDNNSAIVSNNTYNMTIDNLQIIKNHSKPIQHSPSIKPNNNNNKNNNYLNINTINSQQYPSSRSPYTNNTISQNKNIHTHLKKYTNRMKNSRMADNY